MEGHEETRKAFDFMLSYVGMLSFLTHRKCQHWDSFTHIVYHYFLEIDLLVLDEIGFR